MTKVYIVYYSGYGHTTNQANGIVSGIESIDDINFLGSFGGLMAQSPSDAGTDEAPTTGDIETAKAFGARVATVTRDLLR